MGERKCSSQIVVEIAVVYDGRVERLCICLDDLIRLFGDHAGWLPVLGID